ncbi:Stress-associated endoplasmic reticulum 2 [Gossypium arboreum]|uniref:Stress-associated endoplasmic reticulum 2 n=1 Tax=Gossypium arboreum TaxID=29729 RepID=A0A0B0MTG2_GOSAR|nr:Stress-associated endoplasmic reticulum 2 [Gossypium arboreum]
MIENMHKLFLFLNLNLNGIPLIWFVQTTSRRLADRKVLKFEKNITKRGAVPETSTKKGKDYPVGPMLLGFFVFVVIGSSRSHNVCCFTGEYSNFVRSLPDYQDSDQWRHGIRLHIAHVKKKNAEETCYVLFL